MSKEPKYMLMDSLGPRRTPKEILLSGRVVVELSRFTHPPEGGLDLKMESEVSLLARRSRTSAPCIETLTLCYFVDG